MKSLENYIIISIGHTAAGKTSLLRYLSKKMTLDCIEEGQIKRDLLPTTYTSENSLDEKLRDKAYKIAIDRAIEKLQKKQNTGIDASFHRNYRRLWIYETLKTKQEIKPLIIWLYVYCNNEQKVKDRITERANNQIKKSENQADRYYIYEHIIKSFDVVSIDSFPNHIPSVIYNIDTDNNILSFNSSNFCTENNQPKFCIEIYKHIDNYLREKLTL